MTDEEKQKVWQRHELTEEEKKLIEARPASEVMNSIVKAFLLPPALFIDEGKADGAIKLNQAAHDCCSPCSDPSCKWLHHAKLEE